jgi:subtilisin family serine protease
MKRRVAGVAAVLALTASSVLVGPGTALAAPGWEVGAMSVDQAHDLSRGAGVKVAVLDTGIVTGHPDLNGRATEGRDMFGEDVSSQSWYGLHGTSMAGSVLKVAPEAEVVGYRVIRDEEDPAYSEEPEFVLREDLNEGEELNTLAAGIYDAVRDGAQVISMSLGDGDALFGGYEDDMAYAVEQANAAGVVLVSSAGNEGGPDEDNGVSYPAAYPGVISVAASTESGSRAEFSQVHNTTDVAAPGVGIESALNTGGREIVQGTSSAAALASGVVALIVAQYPDLSPHQVAEVLRSTASQSAAPDPYLGHGVITAHAALAAAAELTPQDPAPAPVPYEGAAHFGPGDDGTPRSVNVALDTGDLAFASIFGVPGLIALLIGLALLLSGKRAKRRWQHA